MFPAIKKLYFWTKEKLSLNLKIKMYYCIIWIIITIFDGSTTMAQKSRLKKLSKFLRERMDSDNIIITIISQVITGRSLFCHFNCYKKKTKIVHIVAMEISIWIYLLWLLCFIFSNYYLLFSNIRDNSNKISNKKSLYLIIM